LAILFEFGVNGGEDVAFHLDAVGVAGIALEAQDQIVIRRAEGQGGGCLSGLFDAIDEDVRARRPAGNAEANGEGFEMKLLVGGLAGAQDDSCLQARVAVFENLEAVGGGREIVEAAGSEAGVDELAFSVEKGGVGAENVGDDVERAFSGRGNGVAAVVGIAGIRHGSVVVLSVVGNADGGGSFTHETKQGRVFGGMEFAGKN